MIDPFWVLAENRRDTMVCLVLPSTQCYMGDRQGDQDPAPVETQLFFEKNKGAGVEKAWEGRKGAKGKSVC